MDDITTNDKYPKTLLIRNTPGGMIWQVYHVEKRIEAERLSANALKNGYISSTLSDHQPNREQTWEDWRETASKIIN
jgi:hypothetical protein